MTPVPDQDRVAVTVHGVCCTLDELNIDDNGTIVHRSVTAYCPRSLALLTEQCFPPADGQRIHCGILRLSGARTGEPIGSVSFHVAQ